MIQLEHSLIAAGKEMDNDKKTTNISFMNEQVVSCYNLIIDRHVFDFSAALKNIF